MVHRYCDNENWMLTYVPERGGHGYFTELSSLGDSGGVRIGVADESGSCPDDTVDGPLFLDRSRPITSDGRRSFLIPWKTPDGKETVTFAYKDEATRVAERFKMRIEGAV